MQGLEGMTSWSLEGFDGNQDEIWWLFERQSASSCRKMTLCGTWRTLKDTKGLGAKRQRGSYLVAFSGNKSEAQEMYCVVTVQNGRTTDTCMVFMADVAASRPCQNFSDTLIMANNTRESGSTVQALGNVRIHNGQAGRGLLLNGTGKTMLDKSFSGNSLKNKFPWKEYSAVGWTMVSKSTKTTSPWPKATGGRSALRTSWPVSRLNTASRSRRVLWQKRFWNLPIQVTDEDAHQKNCNHKISKESSFEKMNFAKLLTRVVIFAHHVAFECWSKYESGDVWMTADTTVYKCGDTRLWWTLIERQRRGFNIIMRYSQNQKNLRQDECAFDDFEMQQTHDFRRRRLLTTSIWRVWSAKIPSHICTEYLDTTNQRLKSGTSRSIEIIIDNLNSKIAILKGYVMIETTTENVEMTINTCMIFARIKVFHSRLRLDFCSTTLTQLDTVRQKRTDQLADFSTCVKKKKLKWVDVHDGRNVRKKKNLLYKRFHDVDEVSEIMPKTTIQQLIA